MTVLYFTATGNCLDAAKHIGGELVSITQAVKNDRYSFEDDAVGIVFPVYGLCVPPYIADFVKKLRVKCRYFFAVATYGTYCGAIAESLEKLPLRGFDYINVFKTADSYILKFDMQKEGKKALLPQTRERLEKIVADIKDEKHYIRRESSFARFMSRVHEKSYTFDIGEGATAKYTVGESCTSCGLCAEVCPTDNIVTENSVPHFGKTCLSCLACVQNCPQGAIRAQGEKSTARYRNPNITAAEIAAANK